MSWGKTVGGCSKLMRLGTSLLPPDGSEHVMLLPESCEYRAESDLERCLGLRTGLRSNDLRLVTFVAPPVLAAIGR